MNLAQLRDAVRTRLGVPTSDTFYTDQVLTDLVNEALQAISAEADWPWLETSTTFATVAGTGTYTPPANWVETRALTIDAYDSMEWRSLAEIREYLTTQQDIPRVYTVSGDELLLRPIPASVHTVQHDYMRLEPTLVADTDSPLMPSIYHYSIAAYACHLGYLRSGDTQRATTALADYRDWLQRMMQQRRRSRGPIRVRVRAGQII